MNDKFYTFTSPEGKTRKIPAPAFKAAAVLAVAAVGFGVYAACAGCGGSGLWRLRGVCVYALPRLAAGICRLPRA